MTTGFAGSSGIGSRPSMIIWRRRLKNQPKSLNQRAALIPSFSRNFQFRSATFTVQIGACMNASIAVFSGAGRSATMRLLRCCWPATITRFAVTRLRRPSLR